MRDVKVTCENCGGVFTLGVDAVGAYDVDFAVHHFCDECLGIVRVDGDALNINSQMNGAWYEDMDTGLRSFFPPLPASQWKYPKFDVNAVLRWAYDPR